MRTWMMMLVLVWNTGCMASSLSVTPTRRGVAVTRAQMLETASVPGPIKLSQVVAARWVVPRSGLINLEHERAKELKPGDEPIHISFYVVEHPTHGRYLLDSGVARGFRSPETAPVSSIVASQMKMDRLEVEVDTHTWLKTHGPVDAVLLTHSHLDHIMGLPDLPDSVPVYMGPNETNGRSFTNLFVQSTTDGLLGRTRALRSWKFGPSRVLDLFGDGSLYVLHTPGHTRGSVAFLLRTTQGPRLIVGDASHTDWGWRNCVEPGTFSDNIPESAKSLRELRALATKIPGLQVHLGHQHHDHDADSSACTSR